MSFRGEKENHAEQSTGDGGFVAPSSRVCPTCGRVLSEIIDARQSFCSRSCREIDLMKWLNEEYRFPLDEHFLPERETDERD